MDDKIYRQQAIDILTRLEPSFRGSVLEQALKNMPPAQPERKGHWKLLTNGDAICSECGRKQKGVWDFDNWDSFCRHCGSDMRGERDEVD